MDIRFVSRSKFIGPIREALEAAGGCVALDQPLRVLMSEQGYPGSVHVTISWERDDEFSSDWEGADRTRFPVRIRAAATVLRDQRCYGPFLITHQDGVLSIVRE